MEYSYLYLQNLQSQKLERYTEFSAEGKALKNCNRKRKPTDRFSDVGFAVDLFSGALEILIEILDAVF
jgi:hypothetical protein